MKVAFSMMDLGGCGYYRCVVPGMELRRLGYDVQFLRGLPFPPGPPGFAPRKQRAQPPFTTDVLIVQRVSDASTLQRVIDFRQANPDTRILHEIDDNLHEIPESNPCWGAYRDGSEARSSIELACSLFDGVIASTDAIAERYSQFAKNVYVAYNALGELGIERLCTETTPREDGEIRIGWAGTPTHTADMAMIAEVLQDVLERHPQVRLSFVGQSFLELFRPVFWDKRFGLPRIECHDATTLPDQHYSMPPEIERKAETNANRFYDALSRLNWDIALAPIEPTEFNRGKSWLKVIEYGALGVPAIASAHGPYSRYAIGAGRESVALAADARGFEEYIESLIADAAWRRTLADENRKYIAEEHTIRTRVDGWLNAIELHTAIV